jgi:hypothetical protein
MIPAPAAPLSIFRPLRYRAEGEEARPYYPLGFVADRSQGRSHPFNCKVLLVRDAQGAGESATESAEEQDFDVWIKPAEKVPYLSRPMDYDRVWQEDSRSSATTGIYIWRPIPPLDYVALGYVATTTKKRPCRDLIRCVHRSLVVEGTVRPELDGKYDERMFCWCRAR